MRGILLGAIITLALIGAAEAGRHPANYMHRAGMHPAYRTGQFTEPARRAVHHRHAHKVRRRDPEEAKFGFKHGRPDWCAPAATDYRHCRGRTTLPENTPAPGQPQPVVSVPADPAPDSQPGLWALSGPAASYGKRPYKLAGRLAVGGEEFPFVSGGHGWSIPWGHWQVTPSNVGHWGARHGAIGLNGGDIPDKQLGRTRDGVEIHAAAGDRTAGCVGIREHFRQLKAAVLGMIDKFGSAWLHITPSGASITPTKVALVVAGEVQAEKDDGDDRRPARHQYHRRVIARHHHQRFARN